MILQYLKSTINNSIYYNGKIKLVWFSDTDYASDEATRRFVSGYILLLGNIIHFHGNLKFKEKLHYHKQKLNLLVLTEYEKYGIWLCIIKIKKSLLLQINKIKLVNK